MVMINYFVRARTGNVVLALGLSLFNPQFSQNAREQMIALMVNAQVAVFVSIGIFIGSMVIFDLGILITLLLETVGIWLLGITFLILGQIKLKRIE
jgi:hypothetical protein